MHYIFCVSIFCINLVIQQIIPTEGQSEGSNGVSSCLLYGKSDDFLQKTSNSSEFLGKLLNNPNFRLSGAPICEESGRPKCDPDSPYRTLDGSCNNLIRPTWGMVGDCLMRILPASYIGTAGIRQSVTGKPLPHPRQLSQNIFKNAKKPSPNVNFWFTIYGQAVAHDQSLTTPPTGPALIWDSGTDCCPPSDATDPECLPILLPENDPFYSQHNITCFNFLRGVKCGTCEDNGKRQITSLVTNAIDLHLVYGLTKTESDELRRNDGSGKLKTQETSEAHDLLPQNHEKSFTTFCPPSAYKDCFRSGDLRVNQHTFLTSIQTMWMREHNKIADELKLINPHWDEEKLFQTARRILDGENQAIVYSEYLPLLLGAEYMSKFSLYVKKDGSGTHYDHTLRFGSFIEYTASAFRLHSMIAKVTGYKIFRDMYQNPYPILGGNLSSVVKGSCMRPSQQFNHFAIKDITGYLYRLPGNDYGEDLVSIDILRGRDHGLPPYIEVVNYCSSSNKNITSFDELCEIIPNKNIKLLKQNYKDVQDVDLYVGMQMESTMEGSVLTPTAACIIAAQFYFSKYGDRFYFEHVNQSGSFTDAQRESLKKFTINRLICRNSEVKELQKNAFENSYETVPCHSTVESDVDLNLWKEK